MKSLFLCWVHFEDQISLFKSGPNHCAFFITDFSNLRLLTLFRLIFKLFLSLINLSSYHFLCLSIRVFAPIKTILAQIFSLQVLQKWLCNLLFLFRNLLKKLGFYHLLFVLGGSEDLTWTTDVQRYHLVLFVLQGLFLRVFRSSLSPLR